MPSKFQVDQRLRLCGVCQSACQLISVFIVPLLSKGFLTYGLAVLRCQYHSIISFVWVGGDTVSLGICRCSCPQFLRLAICVRYVSCCFLSNVSKFQNVVRTVHGVTNGSSIAISIYSVDYFHFVLIFTRLRWAIRPPVPIRFE